MRARHPDLADFAVRDGIALAYEVYENAGPSIVFVPTWALFHSRLWKLQIPYLSRHFRVVAYDPRGNGRSDRPHDLAAYSWEEYVDDIFGVMDATGTDRAVLVGLSMSGYWSVLAATAHPERIQGIVLIGPRSGLGIAHPERQLYSYTEPLGTTEGWAKQNVHFIRAHYRDYVEFFVNQIFSEPHSTKAIEDGVEWALETDAETLIATDSANVDLEDIRDLFRGISCPVLIIHGDEDRLIPLQSSQELADLTDATLFTLKGAGHAPNVRDPVKVNLLIKDFVDGLGVAA
ncbi:MAG TPA: alpha/beta hydrolase [Acidimicrobiia bacterium]|nr:alpha/beta hydrolase [Acidimicrobiia bacterium]